MMTGLCQEMKQIEEAKGELQKKLEETEDKAKISEAKHVAASTANIDATASIKKLQAEKAVLEEVCSAIVTFISWWGSVFFSRGCSCLEDKCYSCEKARCSRGQRKRSS
jgi:hypothetical protein